MASRQTPNVAHAEPVLAALLVASRAFVGIVARSLAEADDELTPAQLRSLMIIATRGPMNLSELSGVMGVHPSNATRAADTLVRRGLVLRQEAVVDRRRSELSLTRAGRGLVATIVEHRRRAFQEILSHLDEREKRALDRALTTFAAAAGEVAAPEQPGWEWPQ